jgi:propanediol dehydratase medium subunit
MNEELIRKVIEEVIGEVLAENGPEAKTTTPAATPSGIRCTLTEMGKAQKGTNSREVVIGLPPAFAADFTETIVGVPHGDILRQVFAGIEEEGLTPRVIKVYHTVDVAFIAHQAAKLSGSGIGIGIISRGTTVIHQKDLAPLNNLELFPQSPVMDLETFRAIGKNAALYAKGDSPVPVPTKNDPMARPRYQGLAALLHNKEAKYLDRTKAPVEIKVEF